VPLPGNFMMDDPRERQRDIQRRFIAKCLRLQRCLSCREKLTVLQDPRRQKPFVRCLKCRIKMAAWMWRRRHPNVG
jgi:hypothetical protein